jgi:hypothetical protein
MTQPVDQAVEETVRIRILEGDREIENKELKVKKVIRDHLVQIFFEGPITVQSGQTLSIEGPVLRFGSM